MNPAIQRRLATCTSTIFQCGFYIVVGAPCCKKWFLQNITPLPSIRFGWVFVLLKPHVLTSWWWQTLSPKKASLEILIRPRDVHEKFIFRLNQSCWDHVRFHEKWIFRLNQSCWDHVRFHEKLIFRLNQSCWDHVRCSWKNPSSGWINHAEIMWDSHKSPTNQPTNHPDPWNNVRFTRFTNRVVVD